MSGGKSGSISHQALDRLVKFEVELRGKVAQIAKVVEEVVTKHNDLAAQLAAQEAVIKQVAGFTASEMGKFQGTTVQDIQVLARSQQGLDTNVLALAEIAKEVVGQLTQVDHIFRRLHSAVTKMFGNQYPGLNADGKVRQLTDEDIREFNNVLELGEADIASVKSDAEEWWKNLLTSAFKAAHQKHLEQEQAAQAELAKQVAQQEIERQAAEAAAKAEAEKQTVEAELKNAAEAERTIVTSTSGGPGAAFPEGADIFGG